MPIGLRVTVTHNGGDVFNAEYAEFAETKAYPTASDFRPARTPNGRHSRHFVHDEASTIITHRGNRDFYGQELFSLTAQRTLQPDRLSLYPPEEAAEGYRFETVVEKYTLSDGTRTMDIHHVQGLNHVEGMLIAYLPKEKIVIEADMFNAPPPGTPAPAPTAAAQTFLNNVRRLKLDVSTIAPIHGPVTPWADFVKIMGSD